MRWPFSREFAALALLGALLFWLPDVALHVAGVVDTARLRARDFLVVSAVLPIAPIVAVEVCSRGHLLEVGRRDLAVRFLAGVWWLGSAFVGITVRFLDSGLIDPTGWLVALFLLVAGPASTILLCWYDDSVGGLAITTMYLLSSLWLTGPARSARRRPVENRG